MTSCWRSLDQRLLLGPKLIFSAMAMVYYGFYQYRTNFADTLGFSTKQFGYMSGLMSAVGFVGMALWGRLADWTRNPKLVLCVVSAGTAGAFSLFLLHFSSVPVNMLLMALYAAFSNGFQALSDDQVLRILSKSDTRLYGRQRLWEALSFSVTTRALGFLIRRYGIVAMHYWVPAAAVLFMGTVVVFGTNTMAQAAAPEGGDKAAKTVVGTSRVVDAHRAVGTDGALDSSLAPDARWAAGTHWPMAATSPMVTTSPMATTLPMSTSLLTDTPRPRDSTWVLLSNPDYAFLLVGVFLTGCARSVMSTFLTRYLQKDMGLDEEQSATAAISGVVIEVAIFFGSALCLRRLGIYWMLILAQVAMVVRGWTYVVMAPVPSNWWLVYLVELLKGVAFGFTQTAGVRLAMEVAPPGLEATSQSLYTGMYSMVPAVLVACVGGKVYQEMGARALFTGTAAVSSAALLLFVGKYCHDGRILPRRPVL